MFSVVPVKQGVSYLSKQHMLLFCHSGLDPESSFFQILMLLDAGSVIPDLIRDRHDGLKLKVDLRFVW
jgi:hypothetical protein